MHRDRPGLLALQLYLQVFDSSVLHYLLAQQPLLLRVRVRGGMCACAYGGGGKRCYGLRNLIKARRLSKRKKDAGVTKRVCHAKMLTQKNTAPTVKSRVLGGAAGRKIILPSLSAWVEIAARTSMVKSFQSCVVDAAAGPAPPSTTNALLLRLVEDRAPSAGRGARDRILANLCRCGDVDPLPLPPPTHRSDRLKRCCDRPPPKPKAAVTALPLVTLPHAKNMKAPTEQHCRGRLREVFLFLTPLCL